MFDSCSFGFCSLLVAPNMAGFVEFALMIGCGGVLMLMSQLGEVLQYMQFREVAVVRAETDWDRNWRQEANRQRRNQWWREMWRQSDKEDFENYVDFLGEFEEITWWVEELFDEYCEGWSIMNEEFGNIVIFEFEEEIWDI